MRSAIENIHEWNRQNVWLLGPCEIGNMGVQRHVLWKIGHSVRTWISLQSFLLLTFFAAPAFATAKLTPRIALAPKLVLFLDPSCLIKSSSTLAWSVTSSPSLMRAGPRISLTFATALRTPLPPHLDLSPSLSSHASCCPVRILAFSFFPFCLLVYPFLCWLRLVRCFCGDPCCRQDLLPPWDCLGCRRRSVRGFSGLPC